MVSQGKFQQYADTAIQMFVADISGCSKLSIHKILNEDISGAQIEEVKRQKEKFSRTIEQAVRGNVVTPPKEALVRGIPISTKEDIQSWIEEDKGLAIP